MNPPLRTLEDQKKIIEGLKDNTIDNEKTNNVIEIMSISIGIFMLVDSTLKIQTAIDAKRFGVDKWWLILVMSLVVAVIGILLLIKPFTATDIVMIIIGLNFCLDGILNLIVVQSTVKTIRRNQKWEI